MKGNKLIDDHVQISVNLARYRSHGREFEIVIEPDEVVAYKQGDDVDIKECLHAQEIFTDAKKGMHANEDDLKTVFGTTEPLVIAKKIIEDGEIQFTQKYREHLREQKFNKIVNLIHKHAMNPQTKLPHPENRIRAAIDEAKVHVNDFKRAEDQLDDIIQQLRPIIPISVERAELRIHVHAQYAGQVQGIARRYGKVSQEVWGNDGSLSLTLKLPAGLQQECNSELQSVTHGDITINT